MRIAVHAATLRGFGSGAVGRSILCALARVAREHQITAFVPACWGWRPGELGEHVRLRPVRAGGFAKLGFENVTLRRALGSHDALLSLGDTSLVACPAPHLLLVQQAYLAVEPRTLDFPMPPAWAAKLRLVDTYFRAGLPTVQALAVQTHTMKEGLCARWGIDPGRVSVIPSAPALGAPAWPPMRAPSPYVCYVATPSAHKNFEVLADAMASLRRRWPKLRCKLTVHPGEVPALRRRAQRLGVLGAFEWLGRVPHAALGELLAGAVALCMPSKLESFGLPYYEAMAAGCAVVAADRPFAREACGDAALYADANAGSVWATQVGRLLDEPELREQLERDGQARAQRLGRSWEEIAREYLDLTEAIAHAGARRQRT